MRKITHLCDAPLLELAVVRDAMVDERTPHGATSLQLPSAMHLLGRWTFHQRQVGHLGGPDAPVKVTHEAVGRQREVILGNDLVMIADIRHADVIVGRYLPARLKALSKKIFIRENAESEMVK